MTAAPAPGQSEAERLVNSLLMRLQNHLAEMKPDYDDSITGFNEAVDIMQKFFAEHRAALSASAAPGMGDAAAEERAKVIANSLAVKEDWSIGSKMWMAARIGAFKALTTATQPAQGMVCVPVEPTRAMRKAGAGPWATGDREEAARATYRAMVATALKEISNGN